MTAQQLLLATHEWLTIHQLVHGELSRQERETVYECVEFLINCTQVEAQCADEAEIKRRIRLNERRMRQQLIQEIDR